MKKAGAPEFDRLMKAFESRYQAGMTRAPEGEKVTKTEADVALRALDQTKLGTAAKKEIASDALGRFILSDAAEDAVRGFARRGRTDGKSEGLVENGRELRALLLSDSERYAALLEAAYGRKNPVFVASAHRALGPQE